MTEFFDKNILIHTHIEKTAGSTLVRSFKRAFGEARVHDIRSPQALRPEHLPDDAKDRIYLLTGHFHFGTQDRYFGRNKIYLASVRPPLERFRSYFNFVRIRPTHPGYAAMAGKSFAEVVEQALQTGRRRNVMARTLTGLVQPTHDQVVANLEDAYAIVSPHQKINETLRALIAYLGGGEFAKDLHVNKGAADPDEDIGSLAEAFNRLNALDCDTYQYVLDRYDSWFGALDARMAARRPALTADAG
ncbi:MAG TPA: hypothetical protein VG819_03475 [Rhizomicrobium sp.]|nr:hypothetical protein [Rhizomicrobium sp.]